MLGQTIPRDAKKSAILKIREILNRGEKLVVCAGSKTWADNLIYNLFEEGAPLDIKYAYYHGLLPDDQLRAALQNVDATWPTLDLLVYTPTITVVSVSPAILHVVLVVVFCLGPSGYSAMSHVLLKTCVYKLINVQVVIWNK